MKHRGVLEYWFQKWKSPTKQHHGRRTEAHPCDLLDDHFNVALFWSDISCKESYVFFKGEKIPKNSRRPHAIEFKNSIKQDFQEPINLRSWSNKQYGLKQEKIYRSGQTGEELRFSGVCRIYLAGFNQNSLPPALRDWTNLTSFLGTTFIEQRVRMT